MGSIDITLTWKGILRILLALHENPSTRDIAIKELNRMAEAADKWNKR